MQPEAKQRGLPAGQRLGRYDIHKTLAADAHGIRYGGVDSDGQRVWIREYLPAGCTVGPPGTHRVASTEAFERGLKQFLADARALQQIAHPNILGVREALRVGGTGYVVTDQPCARTLAARLQEDARPPAAELLLLLSGSMDALDALHRAGFLHRRIVPEAIVVRADGAPLLVDLGAGGTGIAGGARARPGTARRRYPPAPGYTPLEQYADSVPESPATDIYALGAVLYRCVTGDVPPEAPSRALQDELVPAARAGAGVCDARVLVAIDAALALRVGERPPSVGAWRALLAHDPAAPARTSRAGPRGFGHAHGPAGRSGRSPAAAAPEARNGLYQWRRWAVPAAVLLFVSAALTWLDTDVLRAPAQLAAEDPAALRAPAPRAAVPAPPATASMPSVDAPTAAEQPPAPAATVETASAAERQVALDLPPPAAVPPREPPERDPEPVRAPAFPAQDADIAIAEPAAARAPASARVTPVAPTLPEPVPPRVAVAEVVGDTPRAAPDATPTADRPPPLTVATVPPGGTLTFAGQRRSYAPGMSLAPGVYRMRAALAGYEPWEGSVVHGDAPTRVTVSLRGEASEFTDPLRSGGVGPPMAGIPAGRFRMGCVSGRECVANELPPREKALERPFALSRYEVTYEHFDRFTAATGRSQAQRPRGWRRGSRPVVNVSWGDAVAFTDWLSAETGRRYRLPTEAEWEYAARAGGTTSFHWGNDPAAGLANCSGCGSPWDSFRTAPVGSFAPNAWGLHDIHGNVAEWVLDCANPSAERACADRVVRGGSWVGPPQDMRAAARRPKSAALRALNVGFRVLGEELPD